MNKINDMAMRSKLTLGVVAISYNEEEDLPGFLDNLLPWVDEIVIVDDFSTDNTFEMAKKAGGKVKIVQKKMSDQGGFSGQRNFGLKLSSCDWVLHMDIDERVSPQLAIEIIKSIMNARYNAFRYRRLNFFLNRPMHYGGWDTWNNSQLARRGKHYFINNVHEKCVIDGGSECIGQLKGFMWHLNDASYEERLRKSTQYSKIESDRLIEKKIRVTYADILIRPIVELVKKYIIRLGFLDGTVGLISSFHSAFAVFRIYAVVWDEQNKVLRSDIEKKIKHEWN